MSLLDTVRTRRDEVQNELNALLDSIEAEARSTLTPEEESKFAELRTERDQLVARVGELETEDEARRAAAAARSSVGDPAPNEPTPAADPLPQIPAQRRRTPYDQRTQVAIKDPVYFRGSGHSYFRDMGLVAGSRASADGFAAEARLKEHGEFVDKAADELPQEFRATITKRGAHEGPLESRVSPSRAPGQGGYFVPPIWLVDSWVPYLRAGRTTANLFNQMDLPPGTDSINIPKLTLGTLVGFQADNSGVTSQDITDTYVTAPVRTIAGQQDVALALIEQSPIAFDEVLFKDLAASYAQQIDIGAIMGTGATNQIKGILNITGTNAVTFTNASPTLALFYAPLMQAISNIAKQRFEAPTAIVMHPSTWYYFAAGLDSQNRPLISVEGQAAFNAIIESADLRVVEGLVGVISGVPIYVDANIPTNMGASTNQAPVLVSKFDDLYLFEGSIRTRALVEPVSGALAVRFQLYNYVAALVDRLPVGTSIINGTGMVVQTGY